jgi:hypothetical protein
MLCRRLLLLTYAAVSWMAVAAVQAAPITIPDASFEEPVVGSPWYTYDAAPWINQWAATVNPLQYAAAYGEGAITPADGNQVCYLNPSSAEPTNRAWYYQTLSTAYQAGGTYTLSMAAAMYQNPGVAGQYLSMRLGYWPGDPDPNTGPTIVAERLIDSLTELSVGVFADFSVTSSAVSGDAVGKPIVVYISRGDVSEVGPQWYVDNIRLSAVPEPGALVLLASALMALAASAWRKRK